MAPLSFRAATYSGVFTLLPLLSGKGRANHGAIMREATRLLEKGKIKVTLDTGRFGFNADDVHDAYRAISESSAQGKLVVDNW